MRKITTMNEYCNEVHGCGWSNVDADAIYFAYPSNPDERHLLVTHKGSERFNVPVGRELMADGSEYRGGGMIVLDPIIVFGTTNKIIFLGGE